MNRTRGFTLLELLVVVIIVGILAAVALPQFGKMTSRARRVEASNMVGSILTAEWVHFQENNTFLIFGSNAVLNASALLIDVPPSAATPWEYVGTVPGGAAVNCNVTATWDDVPAGADPLDLTLIGTILANGTRTVEAA